MNNIYSLFFKAFAGGSLAGISLSEGNYIFMLLGISLLWPASKNPWGGFCWGAMAILWSHKWLLYLHPISWVGINSNLSLPITIFIWLFCGAFGGALVFIWSALSGFLAPGRRQFSKLENKFIYAVLLSTIWGLTEELLSRGPLFWMGIGPSLLPQDRYLAGLARWIGSGGLASIHLLVGWWIWQLSIAFEARKTLKELISLGVVYLSLAHLIGFILLLDSPTDSSEKVAMWQTNIPIRQKFSHEEINALPSKVNRALTDAAEMNASFLIAPEGTLPLDRSKIRDFPIKFLTGGFRKIKGSLRSSLLVFHPDEESFSDVLDKSRLVPLGEWIPALPSFLKNGLSAVGGIESGNPSRLLDWEGPSFAGAICYELSNGKALAKAVNQGAQWILVIANLDPYPISLQSQFLSIAQLRSIETSKNLISVSNTGPTSLIKSNGKIDTLLEPNKELVKLVDLELNGKRTLYILMCDVPLISTVFISLIGVLRLRKYGYY
ncbi:apolipoprotein N-acyltransferase [Prochlorococcus marinus]|uniref:apolipoprotein N-acyltransferase n=1 Tax=Prochlorococcus marinus TaxID=1219 RepID=UPI0022B5846E|nr:apolipoprotein N-acyltransferase [Prochlorococcus marinus]